MRNSILRLMLSVAIAAGMIAIVPQANAWQNAAPQQGAAAQQQPSGMSQDVQAFSGKIVKQDGQLVLKDSATNTTYPLDDQEKAKQFEGKTVKVTGKLDTGGNLIHVQNIEAPVS